MANVLKALMRGGAVAQLYVDDVFSAYTYTGNGSTQTITNGIDLAGEGGMVWIKNRGSANHFVMNSGSSSFDAALITNTTGASGSTGYIDPTSSGFTLTSASLNDATPYVSWTFRNAPNFYHHEVVVKSAGSNATFNFSMHTAGLGMVRVKRTDSTGSWYIWHRSLTAGKLLIGETTAAEATLGHITVSGTTVTLVDGVIADGTYLVEAWAHDTSAEGIIQCGSYVGNGSALNEISLGFEIQYGWIKRAIGGTGDWYISDSMRGLNMTTDPVLWSNLTTAETNYAVVEPTATGFRITDSGAQYNTSGHTYIYLAIRCPNKPPTVGTQVYNAIARTGTGAAATVTGVGFAPDLIIGSHRDSAGGDRFTFDKLRGRALLVYPNTTGADITVAAGGDLTAFGMDGFSVGTPTSCYINAAFSLINWLFRRAPQFFDVVCDTGTGAAHTIAHNLTVAPELMIRKGRSGATQWEVWHSGIANTEKLVLNSTAAKATDTAAWNSTSPTASVFTVGTGANVNTNAATYVTYLFATLAGISKVGSYTGNGSNQTINCGFTTGARFILIKRTDSTDDWYVWDSVRGIVAGNDPHLSLNTTAAEVTTDDSIDPDTSGFIVNQLAATNINVNTATYVYFAVA